MLSIIAIICISVELLFPTLMLTFTYPLNHKWALFWSNYITHRSDRMFFAILKYYRGFKFLGDKQSLKTLPKQFLLVSNHQSLIDIVVYLYYLTGREVRFVAKDNLSTVPMVGKMLKSQGHCMIPRRGSPSVAMRHLSLFGERIMRTGQIPIIFPEGTRSRDGVLGQFHSAGFRRLVQSAPLPVAVCALDGGWQLSKIDNILRHLKKGAYRVKVLKVFDAPKTKEEEKIILEESRTLIEAQLAKWRADSSI